MSTHKPKIGVLDDKGRCCGRKPIHYKYDARTMKHDPYYFCFRCDTEYHMSGNQRPSWAWMLRHDGLFYHYHTVRAAAFDMLEALENLENDSGNMPATAWKLVQDAIAKANGEK